MVITTKLDIGDSVYYMRSNKIKVTTITSIRTESTVSSPLCVIYTLKDEYGNYFELREEYTFATKQDLLDSL